MADPKKWWERSVTKRRKWDISAEGIKQRKEGVKKEKNLIPLTNECFKLHDKSQNPDILMVSLSPSRKGQNLTTNMSQQRYVVKNLKSTLNPLRLLYGTEQYGPKVDGKTGSKMAVIEKFLCFNEYFISNPSRKGHITSPLNETIISKNAPWQL